jgi:hypothetical protein
MEVVSATVRHDRIGPTCSSAQARTAGITSRLVAALVDDGLIVELARGVYLD